MTSIMMGRFLFLASGTIFSTLYFGSGKLSNGHGGETVEEKENHSKYKNRLGRKHADWTPEAQDDYIAGLPGLDYDPGFNQFAGYLSGDSDTRHIFYWYVESQNNPNSDPVVLWTNGGPGCSGLLGFGTEHGPFLINSHGNLRPNPYSWNRIANILYIEQPAGVGFSYADIPDIDYNTGDDQAAKDNYALIKNFLQRYPERRSNDFYIASESYGGHYMPQLTLEILNHNIDRSINFKGMMVGNPFVDLYSNTITRYDAFYGDGLIAQPLYKAWSDNCRDPKLYRKKNCLVMAMAMFKGLGDGINPYALDYPICLEDEDAAITGQHRRQLNKQEEDSKSSTVTTISSQAERQIDHTKFKLDVTPPFAPAKDHYRPCGENYLTAYLNRKDVQDSLHVVRSDDIAHANKKHTVFWASCTDDVNYSDDDHDRTTIPLFEEILNTMVRKEHDLNIMVFSGDDDSICSTAGTQEWIWDLGVSPYKKHFWKPWKVDGQTAGFVTLFDLTSKDAPINIIGSDDDSYDTAGFAATNSNFTFVTVHGAGHEVPTYRPLEAFEMFQNFFNGNWQYN